MGNIMEGKPRKQQIAILEMDEDGISAPNWLFEVLAWISRIEMANSQLSFSCKLFKQLCWSKLHKNVKPYKIKELEFWKDWCTNCGYLQINRLARPLPIPNVPPPPYIAGFNYIFMNFLDAQLMEFLQNIFPRLNRIEFFPRLDRIESSVAIQFYKWKLEDRRIIAFRRLLDSLASKIVKFKFNTSSVRAFEFNRLFPGFIQNVNFLCACPIPEEFEILFDWLALPPINGEKQKILELEGSSENEIDKFIGRIKEEFSNANEPLNLFIIFPLFASRPAHFRMKNEKTGEILTLFQTEKQIFNRYLIVRCPKGEEDFWNKEGQRKMKESLEMGDENGTYIQAQLSSFEAL